MIQADASGVPGSGSSVWGDLLVRLVSTLKKKRREEEKIFEIIVNLDTNLFCFYTDSFTRTAEGKF